MNVNFFDTNVILYLLDDGPKAVVADKLLPRRGVISVQVLNEALAVCIRKKHMSWNEAGDFLNGIRRVCLVAGLTAQTNDFGRALGERYGFSVYDAMIVATAIQCGCTTLLTEDLHDGLIVEDRLTIMNPFV